METHILNGKFHGMYRIHYGTYNKWKIGMFLRGKLKNECWILEDEMVML